MNNSKFILVSVFAFLFLISFASATLTFSSSTLTFNDNSSKIVTVTSNESGTVLFNPTFSLGGITFSVTGNSVLDPNNQTVLTITPQEDLKNIDFSKQFTTSFNIGTGSIIINLKNNNFCLYDNSGVSSSNVNPGDLYVDIKNIDVVEGYGKDSDFFPLDKVEVEVKIENNGNDRINDISLEWGLYDYDNNEWVIEVSEEDSLDLKSDKSDTFTFSFILNKKDLDIDFADLLDSGSLRLYVRATGKIDSGDKLKTCYSANENVNLIDERDFVILNNLEFPSSVQCDAPLLISGNVWNIGNRGQDNVEVKIVSSELGIQKYIKFDSIDSLDSSSFSETFNLPDGITSGTYFIKISVLNEDGDVYVADNDDETSQYSKSIQVSGDCSTAKVAVSAVLQSGGQAGKPLIVKATIVNSGTKSATYLLNAASYTSWANSAQLSQSTVVLNAGESAEVLITLDTKKEIEGEQLFNLEVLSNGKLVANQPVSVDIQKKSGLGITGFSINQDNWHLWGIGVLNLILVIIIIIIAVRITKRK